MTELIVDGNGLVCKLWWANPGNVPERFQRAIEEVKPHTHTIVRVAWDSHPSWRVDLLPSYKSGRGAKPAKLLDALRECRGVFVDLEAANCEADDLIGVECEKVASARCIVVVMSDDKDMAQLVGPWCVWLASGKVYREADVVTKFGVPPDRIRHLLSWTGDKVDGLPGVPGYGPKKAILKALAGEIGNRMTYELTRLAVP